MNIYQNIIIKFIAMTLLGFISITTAHAQGVLVLDQARVLKESQAGQDIQKKLQAISEEVIKELEPEAKALRQEEQALQSKAAGLTPEALQQNQDLQNQIESWRRRGAEFTAKQQRRQQELAYTEQLALQKLGAELTGVLEGVAVKYSASVIIDRTMAILVQPDSEITSEVITLLNAKVTSIDVTRASLPANVPSVQ